MLATDLLDDFIDEANEQLSDVDNQFLHIEQTAPDVDVDLVNDLFRSFHSIKGAAGFMGFDTVNDLSSNLETVLIEMRNGEITPSAPIVDTMIKATDKLKGLIDNLAISNSIDVSDQINQLAAISAGRAAAPQGVATA
ncbi:Chemotaxis protein CheA [Pseudobythopirellula maris]|uniref:Chemotaxis protein CheA n=1 Tax=Pseudobythopirellula maris TaxID=2527991 RepID=A0A5C5ZGX7_9BACT|nr:Hpt domain-containing protein [Pseudobythopirellula maris]TWT86476.1 Chemotaxis protein CheA [Pseudobythopirellula maris]